MSVSLGQRQRQWHIHAAKSKRGLWPIFCSPCFQKVEVGSTEWARVIATLLGLYSYKKGEVSNESSPFSGL